MLVAPLLILFIQNRSFSKVIWTGVLFRCVLIPSVIFWRRKLGLLITDELEHTFKIPYINKEVSNRLYYRVVAALLDMYGILTCIYIYAEDGKLIANIRNTEDFWDPYLKQVDANIFNTPIDIGLGAYMRSLTSPTFYKVLGEYLSFTYFFFYFILVGSWLLAWYFTAHREYFDRVAAAMAMTYLVCEVCFLFMPAAGPYWKYPHPEAAEVGWVFSYLTHRAVEGGSSSGTAFPSSHCGITTAGRVIGYIRYHSSLSMQCATWLSMYIYLPRVGLAYVLVCPGLWFATMWCGFHYGIDSIVGIVVGLLCTAFAHAFARVLPYRVPSNDPSYSIAFRNRHGATPSFYISAYGNDGILRQSEVIEGETEPDSLLGPGENTSDPDHGTTHEKMAADDRSPLLPNLRN
ncbi:hypothetical protein SARC_01135 [Sphaeroforma arctica JP610]|uniref:Inositolphosphotransferase Aur1/Ipt1 domain-containing protein n=1 Tax=Sphaeroforma arctica JP610 TaxID=667725 RepID=A0A0L0GCH9_9EUKA|nr:hypothetical protein SARC_01135 [Sphaeroforma arctica JP610]KNC86715.1 hypothetical protein SARC_01135 [Sphaeroforma arctica JP610]|eukprot:XP_014160617.1 hypothetical protein SARC_01135 [Sphaeroforma arctica JP610]